MSSLAKGADTLLLTGVPGIGKTTLIKKLARALIGRRIQGFLMTSTNRCTKGPTIKIKGTTMMYARRKLIPHALKKPGPKPSLYAMTTPVTTVVVKSAMMIANKTRFVKLRSIGCSPVEVAQYLMMWPYPANADHFNGSSFTEQSISKTL